MSGLEKALLIKLKNDGDQELEEIPVQFNPASLKLTLSNNTEGGQSTARPQRQYTGNSSTELAFDLVFDTADEDDGSGGARNVREKTGKVEQFVLAQGSGAGRKSPPRVMFRWGGLEIRGVVTQLAVDFDLFAPDGTPLRAKMGISIKEQDAKYELLEAGPGSSREGNAPPAGGGGGRGAPGGGGGGEGDRSGVAQEGESAADFARRMGLDPAAWRGLSLGPANPLSLSAGLEIGFDASLSLSAGVGVSLGFSADVGISLEASLGLEASASVSAGASFAANAEASAGFALSAAGGVSAAAETVAIARAEAAAGDTIRAFGATNAAASTALPTGRATPAASGAAASYLPASSPSASPAAATGSTASPASDRATSASPSSDAGNAAPAAGAETGAAVPRGYAPPRADPRAVSYGFGVPLRPRVGPAGAANAGIVALRPYAVARDVPVTRDPTAPPWIGLPASSRPASPPASPAQTGGGRPRHTGRTGCGCGCGPKGGGR